MDLQRLNTIYPQLKQFCRDHERSAGGPSPASVVQMVERHGYLPLPCLCAGELSADALFAGLEAIWIRQGVMQDGRFLERCVVSPAQRLGYANQSWMGREQHKIESLNLMGLTEMRDGKPCGSFRNLLDKLLTTAGGAPAESVAATTFYLLPPYQRDGAFRSAYCPLSSETEPALADPELAKELGLSGEQQLRLFIMLCQLAGHPVVIDLLPQTGRFAKTVFVHPDCFRWYHLASLTTQLKAILAETMEKIGRCCGGLNEQAFRLALSAYQDDIDGAPLELSVNSDARETNVRTGVRTLYHELCKSVQKEEKKKAGGHLGMWYEELQEKVRDALHKLDPAATLRRFALPRDYWIMFRQIFFLFARLDTNMERHRLRISNHHLGQQHQQEVVAMVRQKIAELLGGPVGSEQELDAQMHMALISAMQQEGLWPVEGGGWNTAGNPTFRRLSPRHETPCQYPISDHYTYRGAIANAFTGDMDIITPWYFAYLEQAAQSNNLNDAVIEKYVDYCADIYRRLLPDGFRIDHLDHSADYPFSVNERGNPISYRAPLEVFARLGRRLRASDPAFALFAEYMGWGDDRHANLYHAYQAHGIHLAISTDVVGEFRLNSCAVIQEGNQVLASYNRESHQEPHFATTRILDNHDRSHPDILPALSIFNEERALLKWMKCLFLPGGHFAERPTLYLDGNDTHTPNKAFAATFLDSKSLSRDHNMRMFCRFTSLLRFSLREPALLHGQAEFVPLSTVKRQAGVAAATSNNILSAWVVWPETAGAMPLLVVAHEEIDDKTPPVPVCEALLVGIPAGYRVAVEIRLPAAEIWPSSAAAFVDQLPEMSETGGLQQAINLHHGRNGDTIEIGWLAANEFRIFRLTKKQIDS